MNPFVLTCSALLCGGLLLAPLVSKPDPSDAAARLAPSDKATSWTVDPVHSSVGFRLKHCQTSWFHGRFDALSGSVTLDPENPAASSVQFTVETGSVNTGNKDRDDHLRSPDFLNAKVNPKITFQSTGIVREAKDRYAVTGKINLHGVEKEIVLMAEFTGSGKNVQGAEIAGFEATFPLQRSDFGITAYPDALGEEVKITVAIEATKKG
jgi:polyisoprenoid-binding protein YceI